MEPRRIARVARHLRLPCGSKLPNSRQAAGVTGAIQQAAKATGTSFQYLLATAKVESNLNPNAAAKTSSAGGLFQFIEQTWLGTIKEAGPSLGYGRYANAISRTDSGRYVVTDPATKAEILKLRQDPTANAMMAGVLTKSNAAVLSQKLGRATDRRRALHRAFSRRQGRRDTDRSIRAEDPAATAASVFPNAARANRSIFFDKEGRPRNVAEVSATLSNRFQVALAKQPAAVALAQARRCRAAPRRDRLLSAPVAATATTRDESRCQRQIRSRFRRPLPFRPPSRGGLRPSRRRLHREARVAPYRSSSTGANADDLTPITSTANARVARAYEVLSPNMVRSLTAPVSTTSVPSVAPASVAPETAPAAARRRASLEGEQVYSNPYRAAERRAARRACGHRSVGASLRQRSARARVDREHGVWPKSASPCSAWRRSRLHPRRQPKPRSRKLSPPQRPPRRPRQPSPWVCSRTSKPNVRALFTGG